MEEQEQTQRPLGRPPTIREPLKALTIYMHHKILKAGLMKEINAISKDFFGISKHRKRCSSLYLRMLVLTDIYNKSQNTELKQVIYDYLQQQKAFVAGLK